MAIASGGWRIAAWVDEWGAIGLPRSAGGFDRVVGTSLGGWAN
jgi:hypothetical protein